MGLRAPTAGILAAFSVGSAFCNESAMLARNVFHLLIHANITFLEMVLSTSCVLLVANSGMIGCEWHR